MPELSKRERICLFLDVDGTLLDMAPRPHEVAVPAGLVETLSRVADFLDGALILISGRPIEDLDRLFAPLALRAAGVHGAELRLTGNGRIARDTLLPAPLRERLCAIALRFGGALAEDKGASIALHFRACPEEGEEMKRLVEAELARAGDPSLVMLPGHFVIEVKHGGYDKGTALETFMRLPPLARLKPLMIGDDVTDEAAFRAALRLGGRAWSVGREVPGAERRFDAARDVRAWLKDFADPETSRHRGSAR